MIHDLDRPDVNGVPPKMLAIAEMAKNALDAPYLAITTDDNIQSNVTIRGAFTPKEQWPNRIFQNAPYFLFLIRPHQSRYYEDGQKVYAELISASKVAKFRKYTNSPDKVVAKLKEWMASAYQTS